MKKRKERTRRRPFLKRFLPGSLFGRSLLILMLPIVLLQLIATFVFFDNHWAKITSRLAYAVAGEIAVLADSIGTEESHFEIKELSERLHKNLSLIVDLKPGATLDLRPDSGHGLVWESMAADMLHKELSARLNRPFILDLDFAHKRVNVFVQLDGGLLTVSFPERRLFSSSGYIFLLWLVCSSMILLFVAVLFMRNQIRPIRRLAVAAERLGRGQDVPNFKPEGAYEVRQAAAAFLKMHERIRRQISQRTAMLAGVSHDLRTPLTRLKLQLAMMRESDDVKAMQQDIHEMEKMIGGYLAFVQGESREEKIRVSMRNFLQKIVKAYARQNFSVDLRLCDPSLTVKIQPLAFERCVANLIDNAQKYAAHVWVDITRDEEGDVLMTIEDDGPGIAENEYENVFKPFYREDKARETATGSVGLGMSIAMDIVHAHGGEIWLDKSAHGGLKVTINMPV